ncbi:ATP-dependent RNA helicase DbpA [Schinkia azotoformans MEV2011]|uniref:ATP-dependent RNA helicase DbpA n=1 Tax=Schinkia azotoformans MEV2011 TaxID=1348973 RepID=A0A072NK83_SCHAZ|nr:DEAD/DEAH box helicase [Schinkia azotoformans]KEF37886.1 ATP-dependent RNA helicase DbpA [Schinkia azotoformans MEV2011]MEC1696568.1 DEAD/DEAH box helicase [Schinkia azotoformans]MEC1725941.1 DEAD/DEAH box helicase [Schinkia azotoformans]MEC1745746.1 DEAD/DEAH box helicase [Schinkia azotoformans]MEC1773545.1 DEAD/DEAH box helicase [Schinkia azotoformans]
MAINKSFKDYQLSEEIVRALESLNYKNPTEVQAEVIPIALEKKDLIVKSQTGSGKTASFGIPLCEMVVWEENKPQALILTPTRELAAQVKEDLTNIGRFKRIKAVAVYGKQSFAKQKLELKQKAHVVVGTPGRVLDHLEKGTLVVGQLKFLIIDEADEMLNMGFIDQVEAIIKELPIERTTCVFSATLPDDIENLCRKYMKNPFKINIQENGIATDKIEHSLLVVGREEKLSLLKDVITVENPDSCIIFCGTQEEVNHVHKQLNRSKFPCEKLHGGLNQEDRFAVMNDFKRGRFRFLVATNVAGRGIDIDDITLIINYDMPHEKENYVHRTGRTGRAGKTGKAITFMKPHEEKYLTEIEKYLGFEIQRINSASEERVQQAMSAFKSKMNERPTLKEDKSAKLNQDIMRLYFNGGKKKKLRAIDFVGTIAKIEGISVDDIGIITIHENETFVEILNGKGPLVLQVMKTTTVKGKLLKVHIAK